MTPNLVNRYTFRKSCHRPECKTIRSQTTKMSIRVPDRTTDRVSSKVYYKQLTNLYMDDRFLR